jgi:hypothetical protein
MVPFRNLGFYEVRFEGGSFDDALLADCLLGMPLV